MPDVKRCKRQSGLDAHEMATSPVKAKCPRKTEFFWCAALIESPYAYSSLVGEDAASGFSQQISFDGRG